MHTADCAQCKLQMEIFAVVVAFVVCCLSVYILWCALWGTCAHQFCIGEPMHSEKVIDDVKECSNFHNLIINCRNDIISKTCINQKKKWELDVLIFITWFIGSTQSGYVYVIVSLHANKYTFYKHIQQIQQTKIVLGVLAFESFRSSSLEYWHQFWTILASRD